MSDFPDFSQLGYQVIQELGHNYTGGRVTYLAADTQKQPVVIKQFQFAKFSSAWSGFKAYEREIQVLQGLSHSGIPHYLNSFETPDGFCMVQEYKNAQSLAVPRSFEPNEIKQIAVSALKILVYLQNRIPPIIHRDIKPENILVDEQLNVYLVDFGFARIGGGEVAMSSVALGTLGFMPSEQLYNRQLTEATDLYGLGATLICLLTRTKSATIDTLIDEEGRINFKSLVSKLSLRWIDWLEKLVQPNPKNRYPSAVAALEALKPIDVIRQPEAKLSPSSLNVKATKIGEKLTQIITVSNPAPNTLLEGTWEVAPHPSDPPHTPAAHAWIEFSPSKFSGNRVDCEVTIDTSKLMASKLYSRKVLLCTNSSPETHSLAVNVQTAKLSENKKLPYLSLVLLGVVSVFLAGLIPTIVGSFRFMAPWALIGAVAGASGGATIAAATNDKPIGWARVKGGFLFGALLGALITAGPIAMVYFGGYRADWFRSTWSLLSGVAVGTLAPVLEVNLLRMIGSGMANKGFSRKAVVATLVLTVGLGMSSSLPLILGIWNPFVLAALLGTGLPLTGIIFYPPVKRARLIAQYRQSEQYLIKP